MTMRCHSRRQWGHPAVFNSEKHTKLDFSVTIHAAGSLSQHCSLTAKDILGLSLSPWFMEDRTGSTMARIGLWVRSAFEDMGNVGHCALVVLVDSSSTVDRGGLLPIDLGVQVEGLAPGRCECCGCLTVGKSETTLMGDDDSIFGSKEQLPAMMSSLSSPRSGFSGLDFDTWFINIDKRSELMMPLQTYSAKSGDEHLQCTTDSRWYSVVDGHDWCQSTNAVLFCKKWALAEILTERSIILWESFVTVMVFVYRYAFLYYLTSFGIHVILVWIFPEHTSK